MQTTPKLSLVLVIAGFIGIYLLSTHLTNERSEKYKITTKIRMGQKYSQSFGMDKFWADINWMRVIQEMGDMRKALDPSTAAFFAKKFNTITDLDPNFQKAYELGFGHIEHQLPKEALALLEKANTYSTKKYWRYSWLAGNWKQRQADKEKDLTKKKALYNDATKHYEQSIASGSQPWYVEKGLLRLKTKIGGKAKNSLNELEAWYSYYKEGIRTAKLASEAAGDQGATSEKADVNNKADSPLPDEELTVGYEKEWLRDLIKGRCQKLTHTLLAKKDKETSKDKKTRSRLRTIFDDLTLSSDHFSPRSLEVYQKGDLFDFFTGKPVTPYGIDLYDYEINGRITQVHGEFNTLTGNRTAKTFAALKVLLNAQKINRLKAHTPEAVMETAKK